ncbi:MAG: hypothetical protein HZR80_03525 [Candidatus Heimdallarchaeota archaeon]
MVTNYLSFQTFIPNMTYLSNFYKFFEQFKKQGHAIGRKLGDLLEIIVFNYLEEKTPRNIIVGHEEKIVGYSEADHKVEFPLYLKEDLSYERKMIGFVECKRVGAEVTIKKMNIRKTNHNTYSMKLFRQEIFFEMNKMGNDQLKIIIKLNDNTTKEFFVNKEDIFKIAFIDETAVFDKSSNPIIRIEHVISPEENISGIKGNIKTVREFKFKGFNKSNEPIFDIKEAFPHPATIEKAKQGGWVAVDVRKKVLGMWGKNDVKSDTKNDRVDFKSIAVIGEASHWDVKSRKVLLTAFDYVIALKDSVLIKIIETLIEKYSEDFREITSIISIRAYKNNKSSAIGKIIRKINKEFDYNIFEDLSKNDVNLFISNNGLIEIR